MNKLIVTNERLAETGDLYGIFFEDLNHAADGGLYAEMIRNRSFEFTKADNCSYNGRTAWSELCPDGTRVSLMVKNSGGADAANPHFLVVSVETDGTDAGVRNDGYNSGLPIYAGKEYKLNIRMRAEKPVRVTAAIASGAGEIYDSAEFDVGTDWADYAARLIGKIDDFSARLSITIAVSGKLMLDFVSLFPADTYKNRTNGLRRDLAEMLEAMHPRFMRFPGGCLVHDGSLNKDEHNSCYRWKNTLGDVRSRPSRRSNWRYNQSLGLGYYEYFLFCEDIGAQPLPVLPAAYNPHTGQGVPFDELGEWIDDALDLIEFANGDTSTVWGAKRAELGHPEKFNLKYIAIGNEEVGDGFFDRYDCFHKAIKERYPDIKIINSAGPFCGGSEYDKGWRCAKRNGSDIVDEHYYMSPDWFLANVHRYDSFRADEPKVFLGEYASCDNTYRNALAEAAYMTGLENNAHAVALACYAPLFSNVQYCDWSPVMIWFDNHRVYGTPNYYVQKMFMTNQPTVLLKTEKHGLDGKTVIGGECICGGIEIESDKITGEVYGIRITDNTTNEVTELDAFALAPNEKRKLRTVRSASYTVEMTVRRTSGTLGFKLGFGIADDKNRYAWSIGGWENQDCLITKFDGYSSCLTQNRFSVSTGAEYRLKLVVDGRHITNYINGKKENDVIDNRLEIDDLYYTAGIDTETNEVIIKAVNVNDTPVSAVIEIPFISKIDGVAETISGNAKSDRNSFDEPRRVYPKSGTVSSDTNALEYEFAPLSVNVIRIKG